MYKFTEHSCNVYVLKKWAHKMIIKSLFKGTYFILFLICSGRLSISLHLKSSIKCLHDVTIIKFTIPWICKWFFELKGVHGIDSKTAYR